MAEKIAESSDLESTTVSIYRTAAVVKGGRRFSFAALVVVGDRGGRVGVGYGKAPGVPAAIEKAQKDAKKKLMSVSLQDGTIPHPVDARFGASRVRMLPAAPGTGVIAGGTVRAVLEMAGVRDCLTKSFGSTNQKNLSKAALAGLLSLRRRDHFAKVRGVEIQPTEVEERIEAGKRYAPAPADPDAPRARGPVSKVGKPGGKGRGGGRGRGRRRGGPEDSRQAPAPGSTPGSAPAPATAAPATAAPAAAAPAESAPPPAPSAPPAPPAGDAPDTSNAS